ncbi:hypothetical protein KUTeg_014308 [Tegillarca granosa]|uniref:Uncharacterized protein n=1 Tax=Tegillarca granosa TaxID=220873 RepID=A0ABQ9EWL0_TEGGR|nr:hypothetical protein KUTeg_014308 [Tegillarca granosa]
MHQMVSTYYIKYHTHLLYHYAALTLLLHCQVYVQLKRPAIKSVISQRSPAVVAILPSPKEEATWLFEKPESAEALVKASIEAQEQDIVEDAFYLDKKTIKIGIVGEPLSQFNPQTLTPQGDGNEDEENEGEEGEKQTAGEEPPKEQNPPGMRNFVMIYLIQL